MIVWILLAILDMVALFVNIPVAFGIAFGAINFTVILGCIPMFINEFRDRKYRRLAEKDGGEEK